MRLQPWFLALLLAGFCVVVLGGIYLYRWRAPWPVTDIVSALPHENRVLLFVDVAKLRSSGYLEMIAGSPAVEELEYRAFTDETNFDYRQHLDRLALSFADTNDRFAVAVGVFDWKRLASYTQKNQGRCHNAFCEATTSQFGRTVSFYPIMNNVMAFASTKGSGGAHRIKPDISPKRAWPDDPIWIRVPSSYFTNRQNLPEGSSIFATALSGADETIFRVHPGETGIELIADVYCKDESAAVNIEKQLVDATQLLRKMLARDKQKPSASDISGVLVAGNFRREGALVNARWPLDRSFLQSLASGGGM